MCSLTGHAIAAGTGSVAPRAGIEWVFLDLVCAWVVISTIIMESDAILDGEVGGDYTHSFFRKYSEIKTETKTLHAAPDYLNSKQMALQEDNEPVKQQIELPNVASE